MSGSMIGEMAETKEIVDFCAPRGIIADIDLIRPDQIAAAFDRIVSKDVQFRFVIDMNKG